MLGNNIAVAELSPIAFSHPPILTHIFDSGHKKVSIILDFNYAVLLQKFLRQKGVFLKVFIFLGNVIQK